MTDNPIVDEVHRTREKILASYNGDFEAFFNDMQRKTEEARLAGRAVVACPPRAPDTAHQGSPGSRKDGLILT